MRFELVQQRAAAFPRDLPAAPAILTPVRLDSAEPWTPMVGREGPAARGAGTGAGGAAASGADVTRRGRPAAVLVLLFPDAEGQARVLLTARAPHGIGHAGEISFPGGSAEEGDADPIATALRESAEEVGLDPGACGLRVTGGLEVFALTVSGFRITPVVALAERRPDCRPAPDEVARIIEAPVEAFLPDAPVELEERVIRQRLIRYGAYPVEGEMVWGATARMLGQLGAQLAADAPPEPAPTVPRPGPSDSIESIDWSVRPATTADEPAVRAFLEALAPELAHALPPASELFLAEAQDAIAGLASWAPWNRQRNAADPRGFDALVLRDDGTAAELTLLAVSPALRGRGIGRGLTTAVAAAARAAGSTRLLAWTVSDADVHPSSIASRAFFRGNGFTNLAVDRRIQARGEYRLLLSCSVQSNG